MSDIAVKVEHLSKKFHIGSVQDSDDTFVQAALRALGQPFRRSRKLLQGQATGASELDEELWALQDLSFSVKQGEVLGIIGRNGAGKSTLLKILSRITEPSSGRIEIHGRVGSLLEVGTGFHPELTGRENVYLNGSILSMSQAEIAAQFDAIVEFAGVQRFIDTPIKHYSSGMTVRLAFAVASHLNPEILIIDEVLSVGDADFRHKSMDKMREAVQSGRTVLFVSHNMSAIASLCDRVLLLKEGRLLNQGEPTEMIRQYMGMRDVLDPDAMTGVRLFSLEDNNPAYPVVLHSLRLLDEVGEVRESFLSSEAITVELDFTLTEYLPYLKVGFDLKSYTEESILRSFQNDREEILPTQAGRYRIRTVIPAHFLNNGRYHLDPLIGVHQKYWIINDVRGLPMNITLRLPNIDYSNNVRNGLIAPVWDWTVV